MKNKVATTIKLDPTLYDQFKVMGIRYKLTLQGLVDKCVFRYVNEDVFRQGINDFSPPVLNINVAASASLLS